jgi:hypothetical protein
MMPHMPPKIRHLVLRLFGDARGATLAAATTQTFRT